MRLPPALRPLASGALSALAAALLLPASPGVPGLDAQELDLRPIPIDTFTLDNGLRVIVSEDHSTPVVAVHVWYDVGSAHEPEGRSGFAHLFEHLLFEETENLEDGEFQRLINTAGGSYNGTTDTDRTAYFETLPSNRLNLALWLEAERMQNVLVTERGFETQRDVVQEERRMRYDNQPYANALLTMDTLATDYGPYKHSVIGSMEDLEAASTDDVEHFYRTYYTPSNAVLTVVGDVTTAQVREMAVEYFGSIERGGEVPPLPEPPPTPRADGERRVVVDDELAQLPLLYMAYAVPPAHHGDHYALSLLSSIFSTGESSRLHRRLVKDEQVAPVVISALQPRLGPGLFLFGSLPNQGSGIDEVESIIQEEIDRLREEGVTAEELQKAINQQRASAVRSRMTVASKASALQRYRLHFDDPFRINDDLARYEAVTLDDVRRVARTYLVPENRTVVIARPADSGADRGEDR